MQWKSHKRDILMERETMELGILSFNQRLKLATKLTTPCIKELQKMQAQVEFESFPVYSSILFFPF